MNLIDCPLHHIDILYFFPLFPSYFLARLNSKVYISTVTGMNVVQNKIHLIKMNMYKIICFEKCNQKDMHKDQRGKNHIHFTDCQMYK